MQILEYGRPKRGRIRVIVLAAIAIAMIAGAIAFFMLSPSYFGPQPDVLRS